MSEETEASAYFGMISDSYYYLSSSLTQPASADLSRLTLRAPRLPSRRRPAIHNREGGPLLVFTSCLQVSFRQEASGPTHAALLQDIVE